MRPELANAIFSLYPEVVNIIADDAFDANGNQIEYDLEAAEAKVLADQEAQTAAREASLAKLAALGLTADDVKNILGK